MTAAPAAGAHRARPGAGGRPPAGEEAGGDAPARDRAAVHEPVARGFHRLLRLPARDERVLVVHALRPAQPAPLDRALELRVPARHRSAGLARDQEHPVAARLHGPAAGAVRVRRGRDADARQARRRLLPHRLLPARSDPAGRGHARLRLPPQSRHRDRQHAARQDRDRGAALVQRPVLGEAVARAARALGRSATR